MERVELYGIDNLKKQEKYELNKIVNKYYDKIKREIKNEFTIKISIKEYATSGNGKKDDKKKKKYSIKIKILTSTKNLESHYASWDLNVTLHKVFKKILEEIEHIFKVSEQH